MSDLKQRILEDGKVFPNNVLKVDSFLNHQIDPIVIGNIADELLAHFGDKKLPKYSLLKPVESHQLLP